MDPRKSRRARIVFGLWLVVAVLYFHFAAAYVSVAQTDKEFGEYLQRAVQLVGSQKRTGRELRQLVYGKARELEIPLDPARLDVRGHGEALELSLSYSTEIEVPVFSTRVFHRQFEHEVHYLSPR